MQFWGLKGQHIGRGDQLHGGRDLATLDGAGGKLDLSFVIGHRRRHLGALGALGEGSRNACHGNGYRSQFSISFFPFLGVVTTTKESHRFKAASRGTAGLVQN